MRSAAFLFLTLSLVPLPLSAQWRLPGPFAPEPTRTELVAPDGAQLGAAPPTRFLLRSALAIPGRVGGAFLGGSVGLGAAAHLPTCSGCEDPGFGYVLLGWGWSGGIGALRL